MHLHNDDTLDKTNLDCLQSAKIFKFFNKFFHIRHGKLGLTKS